MNNKHGIVILAVLCAFFHSLAAYEHTKIDVCSAAFFPSSQLFREIYGNVVPGFAIENATKINQNCEIWVNLDWLQKHGHTKNLHSPTEIKIGNIGLGAKYIYPISPKLMGYAGLGISPGFLWLKNGSFCPGIYRKMVVGGVSKLGVYCFFPHALFLDLFVDYLYEPVHFKHWVNLGGFKVGGGLGFKF